MSISSISSLAFICFPPGVPILGSYICIRVISFFLWIDSSSLCNALLWLLLQPLFYCLSVWYKYISYSFFPFPLWSWNLFVLFLHIQLRWLSFLVCSTQATYRWVLFIHLATLCLNWRIYCIYISSNYWQTVLTAILWLFWPFLYFFSVLLLLFLSSLGVWALFLI